MFWLCEQAVCQRMGLDTGDRLETNARKLKFLVSSLPDDSQFPPFEDFDVIHDYLQTNSKKTQARLRKRGQKGTDEVLRCEKFQCASGSLFLLSYFIQIDGATRLRCAARKFAASALRSKLRLRVVIIATCSSSGIRSI